MNFRKTVLSFLIAILSLTLAMPSWALPATKTQTQTQQTQSAPTAAATTTKTVGKAQASPPIEWPKEIKHAKGKIVIYQPQIDEWPDYKVVKARSAIAFLPNGETNPKLGIIEMQAKTEVDFESRLVKLTHLQITNSNFPGATKEKNTESLAGLQKMLNSDNVRSLDLDRMLVSLERSGVKSVELKNDPPKIFYSKKPAVLIIYDSKPILSPIKDSELKFVVNTNWDVFYKEKDKTYFIRNDKTWFKAQDLKGPFTPADKLPDEIKKLPMNDNWKDVLLSVPPQKLKAENMPVIFVSEEPAELIQTKGEPDYKPITQTSLTWVSNSDSKLIFNPADNYFYYLVSGRWFKTTSLENGPWSFATPNLPEDFKKIPADHAIGDVRASIPGTREAEEAIIQATIPQTAKINKKTAQPPAVTYAGDKPEFKPIESTSLQRAENTAYDVIKAGDEYYLCYEGVWFVGKGPTGPWAVAEKVPQEIYKIPPSDPAYNVTYVTIQEDDDSSDEWVTAAVTAGYFGTMVAAGCVYWGTGWYYPPYYYYGGYYPYYYPHYGSYGAAAWYNPASGTFGRSGWAYGPYGGVGYGARYNPSTGTYARGAAAYGPYGARGYAEAYNPRTGTAARTRQGSNAYGNWGSSAVSRGNDWVKTGHYQGQEGGGMRYRTSDGNSGFVGRKGDDLYAGKDGNVYRRSDSGWQSWDNGGWNNVDRNNANRNRDSVNSLDRQRSQRSMGNERARSSQSFNRSRSTMSRGGGGFRGGGRR
ncbi:hypothetical protein L0152_30145 [bacterium]|nr:hypothetical protein [bacterium]